MKPAHQLVLDNGAGADARVVDHELVRRDASGNSIAGLQRHQALATRRNRVDA